jgi:hypothetical protein
MRTNDGTGKDMVVSPNRCHSRDNHAIFQHRAITNRDIRANDTEVTNTNVRSKLGSRIDNGSLCDGYTHGCSDLVFLFWLFMFFSRWYIMQLCRT